jgi:hypothetical protein
MISTFRDRSLRKAVIVAGLLAASVGAAADEERLLVIGLRHERIPLYDCKEKKTKTGDFARKDFRAPWAILTDPSAIRSGERIRVAIGDKEHCVDSRSVVTNAQTVGKGLVNPFERGGAASGLPR